MGAPTQSRQSLVADSLDEKSQAAAEATAVLAFATQGAGHLDERRIVTLLGDTAFSLFPFDRGAKRTSAVRLLREIRRKRPGVVVMEGTGSAGGLAIMLARLLFGTRYVVSSGDAVGPFLSAKVPVLKPLFGAYERLLFRLSSGFIGWTPYLTGRALTFGAPRAMTAAGWSDLPTVSPDARREMRKKLGIADDAIVFGIVGSLLWDRRRAYCYGYELVKAAASVKREDVRVLVVGDGTGLPKLKELAEGGARNSVIFTGRVEHRLVPEYLAAMDVASLPQSVDGVGSFRYTIKLSEYLAAGLPVVTSQIPLSYDLDAGWLWRLRGESPWDPKFVSAMAELMSSISAEDVAKHRAMVPERIELFDKQQQVRHVGEFVGDLLETARHSHRD